MFLVTLHHWDVKRLLACLSVFLLVFTASVQAHAATQWRRYEDPETGLSVRFPSYWGADPREKEYDPELIVTFLAPVTGEWTNKEQPATVELRAVRTKSTDLADVRGLADGFQRYYLDRPHMYRVFQRDDVEVNSRPAVEFRYTMLGDGETRYVKEVWQAVGTLAVSMRFATYADANHREEHYEEIFRDMVQSLIRVHSNDESLVPTDDLLSLGGELSDWAEPRTRSAVPDHELPRVYYMEGGMTVRYPEEWIAQPLYENLFSESATLTADEKNALPFVVTVTDLYDVFIANAEVFPDREMLVEKGDDFWLQTVVDAQIAHFTERVPEFELLKNTEMTVDGRPAIFLEYRGKNGTGDRQTRREVLTVDRRVLYSFLYIPGTEMTRTFEKMVESVVLP